MWFLGRLHCNLYQWWKQKNVPQTYLILTRLSPFDHKLSTLCSKGDNPNTIFVIYLILYTFKQSIAKIFDGTTVFVSCKTETAKIIFSNFLRRHNITIRCYDVLLFFFVSLSSLCFATDEDGCAVENFCNTLFKCIQN